MKRAPRRITSCLLAAGLWMAASASAHADATVDLLWQDTNSPTTTGELDDQPTLEIWLTAGATRVDAFAFSVDYSGLVGEAAVIGFTNAADFGGGNPVFPSTLGLTVDTGTQIQNFNGVSLPDILVGTGLTPGQSFLVGEIYFRVLSPLQDGEDIASGKILSTDNIVGQGGAIITLTSTFNAAALDPVPAPTAPEIDVVPLAVDFGDTSVGASSMQIVTLTNVGNGDLTLDSLDLAGDSDPTLAIDAAPADGTVLAPDASVDVELSFTPSDGSASAGTLEIASDDADEPLVLVTLVGEGVSADEEIMEILEFFDGADLEPTQGSRDRGMRNLLESAGDFIDRGQTDQACKALAHALQRVDGIEPPDSPPVPDFVEGADAGVLAAEIEALRDTLGCDAPKSRRRRCGVGFELALLVPALMALRRRAARGGVCEPR